MPPAARPDEDPSDRRVALVLPGGGARGAYEVGALSVLLPELERRGEMPTIFCGTSVGAINAAFLGSVAHLPADLAVQFRAVPLRCHDDQLVVAACEHGLARASAELPGLTGKHVKFVIADPAQIDEAIAAYYPAAFRTAGAA